MYRWTITITESDPISVERQKTIHEILKGGDDYAQAIRYSIDVHQAHPTVKISLNGVRNKRDSVERLTRILESIL